MEECMSLMSVYYHCYESRAPMLSLLTYSTMATRVIQVNLSLSISPYIHLHIPLLALSLPIYPFSPSGRPRGARWAGSPLPWCQIHIHALLYILPPSHPLHAHYLGKKRGSMRLRRGAYDVLQSSPPPSPPLHV